VVTSGSPAETGEPIDVSFGIWSREA